MQPLAMLLGIVLGSAVSITVALVLTLGVFLFLPESAERIGEEFPPLIQTLVVTAILAVVSAAAFVGELQARPWRRVAQGILATMLIIITYWVWPEPKA